MKRKLHYILVPISCAVIALCFLFPTAFFRYQDRQQTEREEKIFLTGDALTDTAELTILDRLELVRQEEQNYVMDVPYTQEEAESAAESAVIEVQKILALFGGLWDYDTAWQTMGHYTVSDTAGNSVTVWWINITFFLDDSPELNVLYDQGSCKLLQMKLLPSEPWGIEEIPDEDYETIAALMLSYFQVDGNYSVEKVTDYGAKIVIDYEDRAYEIPFLYDGVDLYLNWPDEVLSWAPAEETPAAADAE